VDPRYFERLTNFSDLSTRVGESGLRMNITRFMTILHLIRALWFRNITALPTSLPDLAGSGTERNRESVAHTGALTSLDNRQSMTAAQQMKVLKPKLSKPKTDESTGL